MPTYSIKRTAIEAYRSQRRGGKGVTGMETKEEDVVDSVYIASTHAYLLFFTNDGKVHWLKVHEIPEAKRDARGKALVNLLHLAEGERVAATLSVRDSPPGRAWRSGSARRKCARWAARRGASRGSRSSRRTR